MMAVIVFEVSVVVVIVIFVVAVVVVWFDTDCCYCFYC